MKKLKNILLINWLYFSKELIEVGDVNFLTGKNGAGKSTVIDMKISPAVSQCVRSATNASTTQNTLSAMCVKHFYGLQELIAKILRMLVRKRY